MATIEKRVLPSGKVSYRARVRMRGAKEESASFGRKTDAERWARETQTAMEQGKHFPNSEARKRTLTDVIDAYLDFIQKDNPTRYKSAKPQLEWWKAQHGKINLNSLSKDMIVQSLNALANKPRPNGKYRSPATVNRYHAALSKALTLASHEWGWMHENPARKISKRREAEGRTRFLDKEETQALLDSCKQSRSKFLYMIVVLALSTGMRRGEITNLTWSAVDLNRKMIILQKTKNGEKRTVPLVGGVFNLIQEYAHTHRRNDTPLLFPSQDDPSKPWNFQSAWGSAVERAKLEDFKFHDLRHTAASYLAMNGATPSEIMAVLGHKSMQMVKRYSHISEPHTRSVVERMNESVFG